MGGVNSITVYVVGLKEELGTDIADKVVVHDEEAFGVAFSFTIDYAIGVAVLCCGPFEIELGVDGADEGVSVVVGVSIGFSAIDNAEDDWTGTEHVFAEAVAWVEFFFGEPCGDDSHEAKGKLGTGSDVVELVTAGGVEIGGGAAPFGKRFGDEWTEIDKAALLFDS